MKARTMNRTITSIISHFKSVNRYEIKLVEGISKINEVDPNSIRSWTSYDEHKISDGHTVISKEIHIKFEWMDHVITLCTTFGEVVELWLDGSEKYEFFWNAKDGSFTSRDTNPFERRSRWQEYMHNKIWNVLWEASWHSGEKWSMFDKHTLMEGTPSVRCGKYTITVEDASIVIRDKDNEWRLTNTINGTISYDTDTPAEVLKWCRCRFTTKANRK